MDSPSLYFYHTLDLFKEGQNNAGNSPEFFFQMNGYTVRLVFAGDALYSAITTVFNHLSTNSTPDIDLTVYCWDGMSTGTSSPWLPSIKKKGIENDISFFQHGEIYYSFNHTSEILNFYKTQTNTGLFWVRDSNEMPLYEKASALKNVLSWWLNLKGCHMVHSAAVGYNGKGIMIGGPGGSGKSTTAIACQKNGMIYIGDDYVVLSEDQGYWVHSIYNSVKLEENKISRLLGFSSEIIFSDPLYKKMISFLNQNHLQSVSSGLPICALVIPKVQPGTETSLQKISSARAFRKIAPSTMFQQTVSREEVFNFLADLTRTIPCYELRLSEDINRVPEVLKKLMSEL